MTPSIIQASLALLSGGLVGFSLGLIGGGGSVLAVPLLLYVVGIDDAHVAIGTSALAVAVNAFANLIGHWRAGNVKWPCAAVFAAAGVIGAAAGSSLGKVVSGQRLLFFFALAMMAIGVAMLIPRKSAPHDDVRLHYRNAPQLVGMGFLVGTVSGFFGIGGGFLIVPGLIFSVGMPILNAVGSSLLSVGVFGLTTAFNYALSDLVNWTIAAIFIAGGIGGGFLGMRSAFYLASSRQLLTYAFVGVVWMVAFYIMIHTGLPRL